MSNTDALEGAVEYAGIRYLRAPRPLCFPESDEAAETKWHLEVRTIVYHFLLHGFAASAHVGSQQFVYWDAANPHAWLAPDAFVRLGGPDESFRTWDVWERGAPHLAVEIESVPDYPEPPTDEERAKQWSDKLEKYRTLGVRELLRFDPEHDPRVLRIWDRIDNDLLERAGADNVSKVLPGYWLVVNDEQLGPTLRLSRDADGKDLFLTNAEASKARADRARAEADRAEAQANAAGHQATLTRIRELEAELARLPAKLPTNTT